MLEIDRIHMLRKEKGIKISSICSQLNLNPNYLNDVAKGKSQLPGDRLAQIAEILGTTPEYLKGETDIKEKPTPESGLSDEEANVIALYRSLSAEQQKAFLLLLGEK